eukprot:11210265-Lingulodinium_polyedra.AAC.1
MSKRLRMTRQRRRSRSAASRRVSSSSWSLVVMAVVVEDAWLLSRSAQEARVEGSSLALPA